MQSINLNLNFKFFKTVMRMKFLKKIFFSKLIVGFGRIDMENNINVCFIP